MNRKCVVRALVACMFALGLASIATPAFAQMGSLRGKVVDEKGNAVADAEIVFEYVGGYKIRVTSRTNKNGEFVRSGMQAGRDGHWNITVTKGDLGGRFQARVGVGEVTELPDMVIRPGGATAAPLSEAEEKAAAEAKAMAEAAEKIFTEVDAAMAAKNFDAAITVLTNATTTYPNCASCFGRLGDAYAGKNDGPAAEKAYLKAIEIDPNLAGAYDQLATLYNQQRRFEEAGKMSAKASELHAASGGGDATSAFNAGVIAWNSGNIAAAKTSFQRAIQIDSKMAEAHYYLGMSLINEGDTAGARTALQQYLTLAPTGPNADTAKAILSELK